MTEATLYTSLNKSLLNTPNLLLIANYDFSYSDLLKELPKDVIVLFHALKKAYEEGDPSFYHILNDEKKWDATVRKYAHYKIKPQQFDQIFEEVIAFAHELNSSALIYELANFFQIAPYQIDNEKTWFLFDDFNEEGLLPFSPERFTEDGLTFQSEAESESEIVFSPHAVIWIRLLEITLMNRLPKFKMKAKVDESLPAPLQLLQYVCLNEQKATSYFLSLECPLTSLLEIFVGYFKLGRLLSDFHATVTEQEQAHIEQMIPKMETALYRLSSTIYLHFNNERRKREEKAAQTAKRKSDELTNKFNKQKERLEELRKQNQDLKRAPVAAPVTVKKVMEDHSETVKALEKERAASSTKVQQLEQAIHTIEKNYEQEIASLKTENSGLQQKLQPLLKVVSEPKIETIVQWLELGRKLIQQINEVEEQEIRAFFDLFIKICDEQKATKPKKELATNLYGYVSISSKDHHVHFPNGQEAIIEGVPAHIYLADGQFVQVTQDFEYVADYNDFFDFHLKETTSQFSIVQMKDNQPHVFLNGELQPLKYEAHIHLRDGQIVSFSAGLELLRFYRQQRLQLNLFEQSIALKGHIPYYVQKVLPTGVVVTHALTNTESYITLQNSENLQDHAFITVNHNDIVRTFYGSFYKLSTYYTKSEFVSVCDIDNECFGKKLNREIVIIKHIPSNVPITLNSHVRIDENHHFLELVKEEIANTETIEQRLTRRPTTTIKEVTQLEAIETIAQILIVGNPSFFASHKQKLATHGISVEGIDGYESFTRIKQSAKDKDYIVVCTEFISHDNMYNIKDTYTADKIIYSERDGATQILHQLNGKARFKKATQ